MMIVEAAEGDEGAVARRFEIELELGPRTIAVIAGQEQRAADADAAVEWSGDRGRREHDDDGQRLHHTSMRPAVVTAVPGASSCAARIAISGSSGSSSPRR